ncbi:hypothetical protein [Thermodesulfatator autotrophicus]|uniref:Uncharacterized protein n=1 Tax=Thermodesulfatator autotrophicus TaxID=1795632 RepID=A0A177E466_9BACT|nr:hypothetical protein [Thermodesulfatator autotrophicus]OAG26763.1 hypothetical protein TH606_10595 [Thermodesulfatator autotrophicus]
MKKISFLFFILCIFGIIQEAQAFRGPSLLWVKAGEVSLLGAKKVILTHEDLDFRGRVVLEGELESKIPVRHVEISLDRGRTFEPAEGTELFRYLFRPQPNRVYHLLIKVTDEQGKTYILGSPGIEISYFPGTLQELLQKRLELLARAYMSRDLERYMSLISRDYINYPQGWHRLRQQIYQDFRLLQNIVLKFSVKQVLRTENTIMAQVYWRLYYAGLPEYKEGYIEIHFNPRDDYKIILQRGDLYFGQAPVGTDARLSISFIPSPREIKLRVVDLDRAGAGRIRVEVTISGYPCSPICNYPSLILRETSPKSGIFEGTISLNWESHSTRVTMRYIDKLTADGRRNVLRIITREP